MKLIMTCVTHGSTAILWNGETLNKFNPSRGLRQGDPLSPYLFVLCQEYLSNIINDKVISKDWLGIKASPRGDAFRHLFFANDLIFFAKASEKSCRNIMEVLNAFCEISGQRVNFSKSKMYCSPNVPKCDALKYSYICGMGIFDNLGTYLGFPLVHGRIKKENFKAMVNKIQNKLSGWKANLLSFVAGTTCIQYVSSTKIPNYVMQTTKFPSYICKEIDKLNRNFLWGDTVNKKVHLVNWNTVCQPKVIGGLGIRKSIDNNLAIHAKLGWEIMTGLNTPWINLMRNKYGCGSNPREWARKAKP